MAMDEPWQQKSILDAEPVLSVHGHGTALRGIS